MKDRIKQLRRILNLTQDSFGSRISVKGNTVAQWESGRNDPPSVAISFICKEYNVNENWLRYGTGDMFTSSDISNSKVSNRLKLLRNTLNLTQQEFADRIGCKRNTVAKYEIDSSAPSTAVVSLICREFNVNEEWLRNGTGEMIKSDRGTAIVRLENLLASEPDDSFKHHFINKLADLSPSEWNSLEKAIDIFSNKKK